MDSCKQPHSQDNLWGAGADPITESELRSLRFLVCDLLKKNQELRAALLNAEAGLPDDSAQDSTLLLK